jgi:hypothetical protein
VRLPWSRKRERNVDRTAPPERAGTDLGEAQQARAHAERELESAQRRDPAVRRVAASLRAHRRDNHFAGMLETIFREHG